MEVEDGRGSLARFLAIIPSRTLHTTEVVKVRYTVQAMCEEMIDTPAIVGRLGDMSGRFNTPAGDV